jgi:hypothetical protein
MSQTAKERAQSDQPAAARAEEQMEDLGRRIGFFAGSLGLRIQNAAASVREQANQTERSNNARGEKSGQAKAILAGEKRQQAMQRSEEQVDLLAQRLSQFASRASFQVQRAVARLREEAEDMLAEAQNIRQENRRKP